MSHAPAAVPCAGRPEGNGCTEAAERERTSRPRQFVTLCGRVFRDTDPAYFPRVEYRGRTILLCTDACLGAFRADPDLFYQAHRNSEKTKYVEAR